MNFDKIPKPTYDELVELVGKEKAEEYIKNKNYDYRIISNIILYLKFKDKINSLWRRIARWPYFKVTLQVGISVVILLFIYFILTTYNFI